MTFGDCRFISFSSFQWVWYNTILSNRHTFAVILCISHTSRISGRQKFHMRVDI